MRLDSVRELKKALPVHLERTFAVRASARRLTAEGLAATPAAVAIAASRERVQPSYFLGVAKRGRATYRLAVRLQDRALVGSSLVREISARAKGEIDLRYVGQIRARVAPWYRSKSRPLLIGSSVGYVAAGYVMAGTLGCFVRKGNSPAAYILSNNHVLADENRYKRGGSTLQPGALDGGSPTSDGVAKLSAFVKLDPSATNLVDCAIAKVNNGIMVNGTQLKGLGTLAGVSPTGLGIGDLVHKVGRTTGVRHGKVTAIELDGVSVGYDIGTLTFDDQIEIEGSGARSFSDAGDSGSLIVDDEMRGAALLFAGGDHGGSNDKGLTYANPIQAVLKALRVKLLI